MKPQRKCKHATCRELIDFNKVYCEKHIPKREYSKDDYLRRKEKDGKYFKFYCSKEWRTLSSLYKVKVPFCEQCMSEGIIKKVDVTDHMIEIKDDWSKRLDESNLKNLCHFHHNRKTSKERRARDKAHQ